MAKGKAKTQKIASKATTKKSVVRQPTDAEPLFYKGDIVAVPGAEKGLNFKIVKLLEDVYDESENIKVAYMKPFEGQLHAYFVDTLQGEISDRDIISTVAVLETKERVKGKGTRTVYSIKRHALTKIKKLAKNFEGVVQEEDEEEDEEEEEEEEEKTERQMKKVTGRKAVANGDKLEEEEEETPVKRGKGKKTEEVTRSTKKQKQSGKKGKATKEEDIEDEEEEEEEDKKGKGKGKGKKGKKGDENKPDKYKKGVWNPDVVLVEETPMLESKDSKVIDYESVRANNKNIIRAVYTQNHKLLEECLKKQNFFSTFFQKWGVDCKFNALELAFKNNDKKAIHMIIEAAKNKDFKYAHYQRSGLAAFDTGRQSRYAYGTFTRRVQMGRGNKELNAALTKDESYYKDLKQMDRDSLQYIFEYGTETDFIDLLRVEIPNFEYSFQQFLEYAVNAGNLTMATYLAKKLCAAKNFGCNQTHVDALTATNGKVFADLRKTSATGKTIQGSMTPLHFASINPNVEVLQALLEKAPEYSINDFALRKPIHYAAACTSPEPLKLLISKSVDFREGSRNKMTPLMIAAKYGRVKNIETLLGEGDTSIIFSFTRERMTALHFAAENGHLDCIKVLFKNGADLNATGRWRMTPMILAAAQGHYEIVKWLHENGAKVIPKDKFRRSALILAVMNGHDKIASYLLQNGADFKQGDSSDNTAMHYAAAYGWVNLIDILQQAGADQNAPNAVKLTPLTVSLLKNNVGCMKKLLSYKNTDVNCKDEAGRTIVMSAIESLSEENARQIEYLLKEKKADANIDDLLGSTALHYICGLNIEQTANNSLPQMQDLKERKELYKKTVEQLKNLQVKVVNVLLECGADINRQNHEGINPLVEAIESGNLHLCDILLGHASIDISLINKKDEGIYHFIAKTLKNQKSFDLFHKIADILGNKNGLANKPDILGFTPILKILKHFAESSHNTLETIFNKKQAELLEKKQEEWDEKNPKPEQVKTLGHGFAELIAVEDDENSEGDDEEEDEDEDEVPRKRGKFGVKKSNPFNPFGTGFGVSSVQAAYSGSTTDTRPVTISFEERLRLQAESEVEFSELVDRLIGAIKKLVDLGGNIDASVLKLRPFRRVKSKKEEDLKRKMLADIIKKRKEQKEPWRYNRFNQNREKSKKISEYCAQGNQNALHLIQAFPHPKLLEFLLSAGSININQQDYLKRTPLLLFIKKQSNTLGFNTSTSSIFDTLLKNKADPNIPNARNETPAFLATKLNKTNFLTQLAMAKADLNFLTRSGINPLILSIQNRNQDNVELLLKAGADPNVKGHRQRTPLHFALNVSTADANASFELEGLLLKYGAKINEVDDRGRTPLHYAFVKINNPFETSKIDPVEVITSYVSQKDCNVNVKDAWGCTPLHYAAQRGSQVCALTLLTKGSDVNAQDNEGNTPLAIALKSGHPNIAIMLIQSNANVEGEVNVVVKDLAKLKKKEKETEKEAEKAKDGAMQIESEGTETASKTEETAVPEDDEVLDDVVGLEQEVDEDLEEEEDNDDEQNQYNPYGHGHFGGFGFGGYGYARKRPYYGHHQQKQEANKTGLPEGKSSFFLAAIRKNYQGVAYLMLQSGYDNTSAIQDSMNESKFNYVWTLLTKVEDDAVLQKVNAKGQNLFHTFAITGAACDEELATKIYETLIERKVSYTTADSEGRTPIHYAAENGFYWLFERLLEKGVDINIQDKKGYTPFALQLVSLGGMDHEGIKLYINYKANFNLQFTVTVNGEDIKMGPLTYLVSIGTKNFELLRLLINNGVSINETDENGHTPLIHAIRQDSLKLVEFFLNFPDLDKKHVDNDGKNPIHHVVQPLEYGSFENTEILDELADHFDINATDYLGKTPIFYAHLQDSGVMAKKLLELGAKDNKPAANLKRAATSVIAGVDWAKEMDYEEDAEKLLEEAAKVEKDMIEVETKVKPDEACENPHQYEVVYDDKLGAYDLYMTKVDIMRGFFGGNVFYKMQLLRNKIRDYYTVLTRYGRIGEPGQTQNTPFPSKAEAIANFKKIFKSKSGNDWDKKDKFEKFSRKYRLLEFTRTVNHKEYLVPFDLKNPKVPPSTLDEEVKTIMNDITDVKMYQREMRGFNINTNILPLTQLNRSLLNEAQTILFEIRELIDEMNGERRKDSASRSDTSILEIGEKISEKSSRFYEIIPDSRYVSTPIPPINNRHILAEKSKTIESLIDFEISSRIMLGALNRTFEINPLDYCFNSLSVKMMTLPQDHPEYSLIKQYINASHPVSENYIVNLFALERRGEAERISQFSHVKNKMLLWHGSKLSNFMGILAQGLRIAPPEAVGTGEMFGKGVYFADMFEKSLGYTHDWSGGQSKDYSLLLLCEVALGEMKELTQAENITSLKAPYKSVKGVGRRGPSPDHKIVMPNGCIAPIGEVIDYKNDAQGNQFNFYGYLQHNEYIVYDVNQVRIRYLVQVKNNENDY